MTAAETVREPESTFRCLHEAVADVLGWLGASEGQVLAALEASSATGWPGHPMMDPICRWLAAAVPVLGVQLEGDRLRVWDGDADVALVPLPEPVRQAQARIAAGDVPTLVLDPQPPPLPGPDLQDAYPRSYLEQLYPLPLVMYPADENLTDEEYDTFAARWREQHQGVANAHRVVVLEPASDACEEADLVDEAQARPARQADTVTIPAVPASTGDRGNALVRTSILCGIGAVAAFLLAAGGAAQAAGVIVAATWPGVALAAWRPWLLRRRPYLARHRPGYRPAHAAGAR